MNARCFRLYDAWIQAWRIRCCPPDKVLAGEMTHELEQHLQICSFCRESRSIATLINLNLDVSVETFPQAGELWALTPHLGGWGPKYRWYNPPVVLVLQDDENQGFVPVVQTYGDLTLAGPGDIPLDQGLAGFAEPWNRYTVQCADLFLRMGQVSAKCLESVRQATAQAQTAIEIGSLLWFFRQLEVETGFLMVRL